MALLVLAGVSAALSLVALVGVLRFVDRVIAGDWVSQAEAVAVDEFSSVGFRISLVVSVATGVVFLVWFWRLRFNAGLLAPSLQRQAQGWAFWGWIVPVVSFWFPLQIARDAVRSAPAQPQSRRALTLVGWWWGLWLASTVRIYVGGLGGQVTMESIRTTTVISMIGVVVAIVAAGFAIAVVRALTDLYEPRPPVDSPVGERLPHDGGAVG